MPQLTADMTYTDFFQFLCHLLPPAKSSRLITSHAAGEDRVALETGAARVKVRKGLGYASGAAFATTLAARPMYPR
jgi:hypothetical protein